MTPEHLRGGIDAAFQRKDWPVAAAGLRELVTIAPHLARAWIDLSYVESFQGHYRAAAEAARRAKHASQRTRSDTSDLLARLRTFNDGCGVRELSQALLRAPERNAELLSACALQLSNINDHALSMECARAAVMADANGIAARLVRGQVLAQHGDVDGAASDFHWCLARATGLASAWWGLSRLSRQTSKSNHVPSLRRLLASPALSPADVAYAAFALHKELDDLGDHAGACAALGQACTAKRSTLRYTREDSRKLVDALIALPVDVAAHRATGASAKTPIFIVGMHRSGTTLLEQLLDAHPQVHGVGELYDFTSALRYATDHHCQGVIDPVIVERSRGLDFAEVGQRYLDGMAWRLGRESHFTDKLPSNFLNAGYICQALPQAKLLHMVRDPVETCFSNLRELFSSANPYSYDQLELADYFIQYRRLMAHWRASYPGRILDVDYARLTADPAGTMREVATFCGLDYVPGMSDTRSSTRAVATASAVQVREGVIRRERPKWAPYARHLQPLIHALRQGGIDVVDLPA
ncbi:MAG: sulfotransferase [Pseudomonadota bacterium]